MSGCGNSKLSEDLYDVGYHSLVNIDISEVVIKQMSARNNAKRPQMQFITMDLLDMKFGDESFDVVLDKGTLDALFTSDNEKIVKNIQNLFQEISRVLRIHGRYICISLAQDHILNMILEYFHDIEWFIQVHKVETPSNASPLPVFAFVLTKPRPRSASLQVKLSLLELVDAENAVRFSNVQQLLKSIKGLQEYAVITKHLQTVHPGEEVQIDLWTSEEMPNPRYTLTIVDVKPSKSLSGKFAVFIVPQGREHEWMFSVKEGQKQLANSANFERLAIVALNRGHSYQSIDFIKQELSGKVMEFAQCDVQVTSQVPFLSIGDDVGCRKVVHHGSSTFTGEYIIEDVEVKHEGTFRHLVFLSNKNIVQSEAKLHQVVKQKKSTKNQNKPLKVDFSYLACQHHRAIVAGFTLLKNIQKDETKLLLIGLGGGSLPMFIDTHFPRIFTTVVELDQNIVDVAKNWFCYQESERMALIVDDGLKVLKENSKEYDIVVFDIDSKQTSKALSCPPPAFVEKKNLELVRASLSLGGLFILNLVCRDKKQSEEVIQTIQKIFPEVSKIDIDEEVNEVLICSDSKMMEELPRITKNRKELQENIFAASPASNVDLATFLEKINIA